MPALISESFKLTAESADLAVPVAAPEKTKPMTKMAIFRATRMARFVRLSVSTSEVEVALAKRFMASAATSGPIVLQQDKMFQLTLSIKWMCVCVDIIPQQKITFAAKILFQNSKTQCVSGVCGIAAISMHKYNSIYVEY